MPADRDQLRAQLIARFESHPPSTWSVQLLEIVVNAIDIQFGSPGEGPAAVAAAIGALPQRVARDLPQDVVQPLRQDAWLTRQEVADRAQVSPKTLAQWATQKKGPRYARFGGHVRYRLSDVAQWEEEQLQGMTEPRRGQR